MGARGESVIHTSNGEIYLLFTNRAILTAEKQLGKGILGVLDGFVNGSSGYTDLVALLRAGRDAARMDNRGSGRPVSNNDALDVIDQVGFAAAITPVMEALAAVISYDAGNEDSQIGDDGADPN